MAEDIPYIGSRISLISKSDIRYEGVLFTIDMEQSSIALKDVVSHGTEGRRLHGPQVPPSGEVYEYIIFKGDDIKDLTVLGPSAPPASTPMNDPAVLSVGAYGAPPPAPPAPAYQAPNAWGAPPAAPAPQPQYASLYGDSQWGPPAGPAPPAPQPPPRSAQVAPQVQITPAGQPPRPAQPPPKPTNYAMAAGARPTAGPGGRGPSGPPAGGRGGPAPYGGRGGQGGYHATLPGSGGRGMGGGRGPAPPSRPPPPPAPAPIPVPSEDFNFELQNAKFNKDELVKELKVEKAGKKVDDFFDEISCEAVERLTLDAAAMPRDGRSRAADARRLDIETFGGMGNVQRHYGGGPGGRGGRGGRGGPSGRGGRGEGRGGSGRGGLRPNATGVPVGAGGGGGRGNRY